jgi:hypothetical protein
MSPLPRRGLMRGRPSCFPRWRRATYDASFAAKARMAAINTLVKLRKHQSCCGNHGQPGC